MNETKCPCDFTIGTSLNLKIKRGVRPLMPLVQATYTDEDRDMIQISVNLFINETVKLGKDNLIIARF